MKRAEFNTIGHATRRKDGVARVTGQEQYTTDVSLPRMLHGRIVGSPYAHAQIVSVDATAAEALGAVFKWPVMTREVNRKGLVCDDGTLYPADTVIISIGDVPKLNFLPDSVECVTVGGAAWIKTDEAGRTSDAKILAVGDVERPGLATNALGAGKRAAPGDVDHRRRRADVEVHDLAAD